MKRLTLTLAALLVAALPLAAQTPTPVQESNGMNAQEKANLKFVMDWWRIVIQARHTEMAPMYQAETYMQHNPNILTGAAAWLSPTSVLTPRFIKISAQIDF